MSDENKTLLQEVMKTMPGPEKDISAHLGKYRVLVWFRPLSSGSLLMNIVSALSKRVDWEAFEPGTTPIISVHSGAIYSFKDFTHQHAGINEVYAFVFSTSTESALKSIMSIIESLQIETLVKMETSKEIVLKAETIIPLRGLLCFENWIEAEPINSEYEPIDARHETNYIIDVKRPRDSVEADLFNTPLDEREGLRLLLRILGRKRKGFVQQSDDVMRCWELLRCARNLQVLGEVDEAGVIAGSALEELLISRSGVSRRELRRDRVSLAKIISIVEKQKRLQPSQTEILRKFAELRAHCARAISCGSKADEDYTEPVGAFIDWLESYPEWLR